MWSPSSSAPPTHHDDVRALIIEDYAIDNLYKKKCRRDFYEERIKKENSFDYYDQYTSTAPSNKKTRNNSNKNKLPRPIFDSNMASTSKTADSETANKSSESTSMEQ